MLYLLGIPLAIAGAKILHDDIKYTAMDLRIDNASIDLDTQYKQIEENFEDILQYSGARCKIKIIGIDRYSISNVQKGQYGGMERYLAEKGFYHEAINYAKKLFDDIADEETRIKNKERDRRIDIYETQLITEKCSNRVITIRFNKFICNKPKFLIEKDVEKLIAYFKTHNNERVYCNIIMENDNILNHKEVWHIKEPVSQFAEDYYKDVYDKVINNDYTVDITEDADEINQNQNDEVNISDEDNKVNTSHCSTKNRLNAVDNSQRASNSPRRLNINDASKIEMNSTLKHIVDEFKICPDINIVSIKVGIPAKKIKKWYNKKDGKYKLFHDAIADLNPYMTIKIQHTSDSSSIDSQLNLVTYSFKKYEDIKLVSKYTGISEDQILLWLELGKGGSIPYTYLYNEVSKQSDV